jgi:8-oxo-dGTP diphosphatase
MNGYVPIDEQEEYFLASYPETAKGYPRIEVTVDLAVFAMDTDGVRQVLLVERKGYPYKGYWALPGGFVNPEETLSQSATRELREETGVEYGNPVPLGVADEPHRDPRGRVISHVFTAHLSAPLLPRAGDDAVQARWIPLAHVIDAKQLAFDHTEWVRRAAKHWGLLHGDWEGLT